MEHGKKNDRKRWNNKSRKDHSKKERISDNTINTFVAQNREAIRTHKLNIRDCPYCSEPIADISSALIDKITRNPMHFDCVLKKLHEQETLAEGQKITYIGQGRFAIVLFENSHDLRKFAIVRIIEWEERDKPCEWRSEIAELYSQTM